MHDFAQTAYPPAENAQLAQDALPPSAKTSTDRINQAIESVASRFCRACTPREVLASQWADSWTPCPRGDGCMLEGRFNSMKQASSCSEEQSVVETNDNPKHVIPQSALRLSCRGRSPQDRPPIRC